MAKILNKAKQNRAEECVKCARHCVEIEASDGDIREKGTRGELADRNRQKHI